MSSMLKYKHTPTRTHVGLHDTFPADSNLSYFLPKLNLNLSVNLILKHTFTLIINDIVYGVLLFVPVSKISPYNV